ncbi:MAG: RsmE family RNA methyltransferase [Candidatus Omnitrophota bacterium]
MRKFFIDKKNIKAESLQITGSEAHHIRDVIRLKPGDAFIGLDAEGFQYFCKVKGINRIKVEAVIENTQKILIRIPDVTLACAIPKASRMDYIVQKAVELKVKCLIPVHTARTQVLLNKNNAKSKIGRWEKIARQSSKQCGRAQALEITNVTRFDEVIENSDNYKTKIIPSLCSETKPIKNILTAQLKEPVIILIGPEGDFTNAEAELAKAKGFIPASLGPLVLRVDTAAVFTISAIMYELFT